MEYNENKENVDLRVASDEAEGEKAEITSGLSNRYPAKGSKLVDMITKYSGGLVKNEKQASYIVLAFVALIIAITIALWI